MRSLVPSSRAESSRTKESSMNVRVKPPTRTRCSSLSNGFPCQLTKTLPPIKPFERKPVARYEFTMCNSLPVSACGPPSPSLTTERSHRTIQGPFRLIQGAFRDHSGVIQAHSGSFTDDSGSFRLIQRSSRDDSGSFRVHSSSGTIQGSFRGPSHSGSLAFRDHSRCIQAHSGAIQGHSGSFKGLQGHSGSFRGHSSLTQVHSDDEYSGFKNMVWEAVGD